MSLIETVDLYQRFSERDVLKNINLSIEQGEVFALIGPTGAGKTTLLRLIDLLDIPSSGRVYFDGVDTAKSATWRFEARRRMSFVLQKPVVFNTSVYDNIAYALKWRGVGKGDIRQRVSGILEMVDLSAYKHRKARTLSGGEVQRVAIARAVAVEPEVLLLDEPTANLDPVSASKIEELIINISQQHNTTIIMATHDMSQGQRLADRVSVLIDGEIMQTGHWQDVLNSPGNRKIADFAGVENIIDGVITSSEDRVVAIDVRGNIIQAISDYPVGEEVCACLRPEDITLALSKHSSSARNSFAGEITRMVSMGSLIRIELDCGFPVVSLITKRSTEELDLKKGKQIVASFKATAVHVIKREIG